MTGFELSQVIIKFENSQVKTSFQLPGHNGPNVLDHVNHQDGECVRRNSVVMG